MAVRILFIGDAAATGFGTVTSDLGKALLALGEDVRFLSQNMAAGLPPEPIGSRTYTLDADLSPDAILAILTGKEIGWEPEAILVLGDYFAARWITVDPRVMDVLRKVPSYHYCPVEGIDLPPAWRSLWDVVKPVAMSKFGAVEIAKVVGYEPPMVYHGVDTDYFYPISPGRPSAHVLDNGARATNKASAKQAFGLDPTHTILLRTDRHMPRKLYPSLLRAAYPVMEAHPDVDLVIHCRIIDDGGFMQDTIRKYPGWFGKRILFTLAHDTFTGLSREELNLLYNAADIYCSVSSEGFGLTIAEAIACGVPALGQDYSAVPEVIGPAGVAVPISHLIDNPYDHFWAVVDERAYSLALDRLVTKPSLRRSLGAQGPAYVARNFSWTRAAEQFRAILAPEAVAA
jgi:glycosyltransferase involved in cell wall biosynthesis